MMSETTPPVAVAAEIDRRVKFLGYMRTKAEGGPATLATQMAHAADLGWAIERNAEMIVRALRAMSTGEANG